MAEIKKPIEYSPSWTFFEGKWHDGNVPIMGPRTHAAWLGSVVFDGARAFEGVAPDLDRHVARANQSAVNFGLKPVVDAGTWLTLANEGIARFADNAELYVRPMYWAQNGAGGGVLFDPETTNWCLCIYEAPMPKPVGNAITLSPFRRPTAECAPVEAKAACLYPNNSRALAEAAARGFQNALMLDMLGNVAEFGNSNVFMAKDGVVFTPVPNGTFLNGITRQRVIGLLRADGVTVVETTLRYADFLAADEIFSTGNFAKVAPVIRIDERELKPGPLYTRARKLYWDFAHAVKLAALGPPVPSLPRCARNNDAEAQYLPNVVPAKAGTHNHRMWFGDDSGLPASRRNSSLGVWVPACAGTTAEQVAASEEIAGSALWRAEKSYSSFFDIRSRRSCISFICWRRSSMLLSLAGSAFASGSGSGAAAGRTAPGANGLNIENVCWNSSMLRRTCSSRGAKGVPDSVLAICLRNFSCSWVSVAIDCSRYFGTTICMLSP